MRFDSVVFGLVAGLLAPIGGFFIYALIYTTVIRPHLTVPFFMNEMFLGTPEYQAPITSLALIANVPLFFALDRFGLQKAMRGVLVSFFIYGTVIVVLWF